MAHYQQLEFVQKTKDNFPEFFRDKRVLEIGSWDTNGTVRKLFEGGTYLGVDVSPGPGVDLVRLGNELDEPSESFDVVISCECFEHNPYWLETLTNMIRMLKTDGLCLITCATTGRIEHGTPRSNPLDSLANIENVYHYYRNLEESDFQKKIDLRRHFKGYFFVNNIYHCDLFFVGLKLGSPLTVSLQEQLDCLNKQAADITTEVPPTPSDRKSAYYRYLRNRLIVSTIGEEALHDFRYARDVRKRKNSEIKTL